MKLHLAIESWAYRTPFRISRGAETALDVIVVTLTDALGNRGRGEAAGVDYEGESVQSMSAQVQSIAGRLTNRTLPQDIQDWLPSGGARNALDCALWDLQAKATGVSVWSRLGMSSMKPVTTCLTLGMDTLETTVRAAQAAANLPRLKLKVNQTHHLETIAAVRRVRPDAMLIIDPNQAWSVDLLNTLAPELQALDVRLIEQPIRAGSDAELAHYTGSIALAADESCVDRRSLAALAGLYRFINIKLDKCGGLTESLALARAARESGFDIMVGCMAGTSLAMAPAMAVAQFASIADLDGPLLHRQDRTPGIEYRDGVMQAPPPELWG